jgi:hypothetical protein
MKTKITLSAHELGLDGVFSRLAGLKTESTRASALRFLLPHLIEVGRLPQWFLGIVFKTPCSPQWREGRRSRTIES